MSSVEANRVNGDGRRLYCHLRQIGTSAGRFEGRQNRRPNTAPIIHCCCCCSYPPPPAASSDMSTAMVVMPYYIDNSSDVEVVDSKTSDSSVGGWSPTCSTPIEPISSVCGEQLVMIGNHPLHSFYKGVKTMTDAERLVGDTEFILYHQLPEAGAKLALELPMFVVYRSSSSVCFHYRVVELSNGRVMVECCDPDKPSFASIRDLVKFYSTFGYCHRGTVELFPLFRRNITNGR